MLLGFGADWVSGWGAVGCVSGVLAGTVSAVVEDVDKPAVLVFEGAVAVISLVAVGAATDVSVFPTFVVEAA